MHVFPFMSSAGSRGSDSKSRWLGSRGHSAHLILHFQVLRVSTRFFSVFLFFWVHSRCPTHRTITLITVRCHQCRLELAGFCILYVNVPPLFRREQGASHQYSEVAPTIFFQNIALIYCHILSTPVVNCARLQ